MIKLLKLLTPVLCFLSLTADAFVNRLHSPRRYTQFSAVSTEQSLSLSLRKPLGLILEEVEEGKAAGVYVAGLAEAGSALEYASQLQGAKVTSVQGTDVSNMDFDAVMDQLVNAPNTVDLQFFVSTSFTKDEYAVGTPVTIKFLSEGRELEMKASVGDNLRKVMLNNGVEVYQGVKQKLGNCGGGGTCTFCAVNILDSEGWVDRSEYEDQKLAKFPGARLACLNSIQGPATIQKTKR